MQSDLTAAICKWTLFADNAPPKKEERTLGSLRFNERMTKMIDKHPKSQVIYQQCHRLPD